MTCVGIKNCLSAGRFWLYLLMESKKKNNLCCLHPWCTGGKATMCPDYKGLAANELIVLYRSLYGIDQYATSKYYIPSKRFNQPASALMSHNSVPTRLSCGCWSLSKQSSRLPWVTLNWLPVYHRTRVHVFGLWEDVRCGLGNMPTVHRKTWIGIKHATIFAFWFQFIRLSTCSDSPVPPSFPSFFPPV